MLTIEKQRCDLDRIGLVSLATLGWMQFMTLQDVRESAAVSALSKSLHLLRGAEFPARMCCPTCHPAHKRGGSTLR